MMAMASSTAVATKGRATRPAVMPTLLTAISKRPSDETTRRASSAAWARSLTSATTATARPPSASMASVVACARAPSMSFTATAAPARASHWAICWPMPAPAPVTSATEPSSEIVIDIAPRSAPGPVLAIVNLRGPAYGRH